MVVFLIGLLGGCGFSLFILSYAPNSAKGLLQMIFVLIGVKLGIGLFFALKWRTRPLGVGLMLSIPLTILLIILYVGVRIVLTG